MESIIIWACIFLLTVVCTVLVLNSRMKKCPLIIDDDMKEIEKEKEKRTILYCSLAFLLVAISAFVVALTIGIVYPDVLSGFSEHPPVKGGLFMFAVIIAAGIGTKGIYWIICALKNKISKKNLWVPIEQNTQTWTFIIASLFCAAAGIRNNEPFSQTFGFTALSMALGKTIWVDVTRKDLRALYDSFLSLPCYNFAFYYMVLPLCIISIIIGCFDFMNIEEASAHSATGLGMVVGLLVIFYQHRASFAKVSSERFRKIFGIK